MVEILALEAGMPAKTHVLNVLRRWLDGKPQPPLVDAPPAFHLSNQPAVSVVHFDAWHKARNAQAPNVHARTEVRNAG